MTGDIEPPAAGGDAQHLRVFLSYSRRDGTFLAKLAEALIGLGYEATYDASPHGRNNPDLAISAEDEWWKALEGMIAKADVMVFVVSRASAESKVCDEEIAYARRLGKRVIAILREEIDFRTAPPKLAALNVKLRFTDNAEAAFAASLAELKQALDLDAGWWREQKWFAVQLKDWLDAEEKARPGWLLSAAETERAEMWAARRPPGAQGMSEEERGFLAASRENVVRQARNRRRMQGAVWVLTAAAMLITIVGAWFVMQGQRQVARRMSAAIAQEASDAYDQGRYDRALRLGVLASHDTWLSPAAGEAAFAIGRAMAANRLEARFSSLSLTSCLSVNADGTLVVMESDDAPHLLARDIKGEWAEQDLPGADRKSTTCAAFAPDGASFVTTGGETMLWTRGDIGWTAQKLDAGGEDVTQDPILLSSGRIVATATSTILVWTPDGLGGWTRDDLTDEQKPASSAGSIDYVQASADGKRLLSVSSAAIQVWTEIENGYWRHSLLWRPGDGLAFAALTADGERVILRADDDIRILMENGEGAWSGDQSGTIEPGADYNFSDIQVSPDGRSMLTSGMNSIRFWTGSTGSSSFEPHFGGEIDDVAIGPFSASGNVFVGTNGGRVKAWKLADAGAMDNWDGDFASPVEVTGEEHVVDVALSADGNFLATGGLPEPLEIWRLGGAANGTLLDPGASISFPTKTAAYSPSSKRLVEDNFEGNILVWEQGDTGRTAEVVAKGALPSFTAMPEEDTVVVNGNQGLIVYSRDKGAAWGTGRWVAKKLESYHGDWASVSGDGRRILAPSQAEEVRVWTRGADGKWSSTKLVLENRLVVQASISADGSAIVSSDSKDLLMWRQDAVGAWKPNAIGSLPGGGAEEVVFGAGGNILSASDTGVLLWSPKLDGTWAFERVSGAEFPADRAELARTGGAIVTTKNGAPARVWRRRDDGKWISTVLADGEVADGATLAPDGHEIALLLSNGTTVFDATWLVPGNDLRATRQAGTALAMRACETSLGGTGSGGMRRLTAKDTDAAPIVGLHAGEDVCAWQPAWYDGVLDALFGWME